MKKYLFLYIILIVFAILSQGCSKKRDFAGSDILMSAQEQSLSGFTDYYWYKGSMKRLVKKTEKKYIMLESENETTVLEFLSRRHSKLIAEPKQLDISNSVKKGNKKNNKQLKWAIIDEGSPTLPLADNESIIYESPFYNLENGKEVGISHLFYVKLKSQTNLNDLMRMALANKVEILGNNEYMPLWYTLACDKISSGNALELANKFFESGLFSESHPDLMAPIESYCANDPQFGLQWNLYNTGQHSGTAGVDVNFCNAKNLTSGSANVIVAIFDDGVELSHQDLNIHSESYDTYSGTSPSIVRGAHGTACAGISGAITDNNYNVAGIASQSPIMSISVVYGVVDVDAWQKYANGYFFAINNGASVISNSWGGGAPSPIFDDAIEAALSQGRNGLGCVVVFAAGNYDSQYIGYPANSNSKIVVVGALSYCGTRKSASSCDGESTWGSNYGNELDIVAPGVMIPTSDLSGGAGYSSLDYTLTFNGTSAATPHVSAAAALILSVAPNITQEEVVSRIESSARKIGNYQYAVQQGRNNGTWNLEVGYGLLDIFAALTNSSCNTVSYNNQNVTTNTYISGCNLISENVTVSNNSVLTFSANQSVQIKWPFTITPGSSFNMTVP